MLKRIMSESDTVRVPSDLATTTQTFEMGCMATNVLYTYVTTEKNDKQDSILVGCVPTATVASGGVGYTLPTWKTPGTRDTLPPQGTWNQRYPTPQI